MENVLTLDSPTCRMPNSTVVGSSSPSTMQPKKPCSNDVSETTRVYVLEIADSGLFEELWRLGLFREINARCATLVDDYEEEMVDAASAERVIAAVDAVAHNAVAENTEVVEFLGEPSRTGPAKLAIVTPAALRALGRSGRRGGEPRACTPCPSPCRSWSRSRTVGRKQTSTGISRRFRGSRPVERGIFLRRDAKRESWSINRIGDSVCRGTR